MLRKVWEYSLFTSSKHFNLGISTELSITKSNKTHK
jgi:hypothetical protein